MHLDLKLQKITENKRMYKYILCKEQPQEAWRAYTDIRLIDVKTKYITRDEKWHNVMTEW